MKTSHNNNLPKVCYEIFVRSFCDSNNDGIGDLNGITSKLDYLENLGIEAIWLTPFFTSPSYHKYDVTNYKEIDPEYGTMDDFERLISEAHRRNIKVIIDLVINHTSIRHRWFREAKKGADNPYRSFYNWLSPEKIKELGIARREKTADSFETDPWHWANKRDKEKYYGMFWSGMADLNIDEPQVRREIYDIGKFWLNKGVDGFRMDAAKHIYPDNEAHKAHAFWEEFRNEMETVKPDFYIVGEVWTSAELVAPFFKGLKANFNFDLSYGIQDIVLFSNDNKEIVKMLLSNYALFKQQNLDFIDATMLTNHDQNRIGSVVNGDRQKLKMAANLLLTLPGNPFIYYGEELGMKGVKPDEGIREAFLWDIRKHDGDRTNWRKPKYNTDSRVTPLKQQKADSESMYNHYRKLIHLRKSQPALNQISPPNLQESPVTVSPNKLVAFVRPHESGNLLVVQNISSEEVKFKFPEYQKIIHDELSTAQRNVVSAYALIIVKL